MASCEIQWIVDLSANSAYAAAALLAGGQSADTSRVSMVDEPIRKFRSRAGKEDAWLIALLNHIAPLSTIADGTRHVVETALRKLVAGNIDSVTAHHLSDAVQELFAEWNAGIPECEHELKLRRPVLEENWAARGPGLLSSIGRFTDNDLIAPRASVILVDPLLGGGGTAYLPYNAVAVEAVLANPHNDLPEIVRLAWLLAQLRMDAPIHGEMVHGSRLLDVAALAMLPPTLQAAEIVELCQFSPETAERAIEVWRIPVNDRSLTAQTVLQWWGIYQRDRPRWSVALAALDQMLD
jgi:hypothetical protein